MCTTEYFGYNRHQATHGGTATSVFLWDVDYFKRGIKEAIYIRALQPSLNRDGWRYRLQTTIDRLLTSHVGKITCPQHLAASRSLTEANAPHPRSKKSAQEAKKVLVLHSGVIYTEETQTDRDRGRALSAPGDRRRTSEPNPSTRPGEQYGRN
ncbi:hypothetical protein Bbelb_167950 [Branchiostoma belcheri]|nr:hypothetical protein Bbelb_167950 [Branchiostoma belcheri]